MFDAGAGAACEAGAGAAEDGPGGRGIRLLALAENLRSSTNVLKRDVTPPSFCLPRSILSAWRSRKPGGGGSESMLPCEARAGGAGAVPEFVRVCEKRDCGSDEPFASPIPSAGTETPAFERRDVASWLIYPWDGGGTAE